MHTATEAGQCQRLCQNTDSCEYWTWILYDEVFHEVYWGEICWLKYSKEQVVNEEFTNWIISGPKYCPSTTSTTPITSINLGIIVSFQERFKNI